MEHERGEFRRGEPVEAVASAEEIAKAVSDLSEDEFADWLTSLPPPSGLIPSPEEDEAALTQADEDMASGRYYPHSVVSAWMKTWGSPDFKPFKEWLKSSG